MVFLWSFLIGGAICTIGQILIDKFKFEPAKVIVTFITVGTLLPALGIWTPLKKIAPSGFSTPIMGFGAMLAEGSMKAGAEKGLLGVLSGGLIATSYGIAFAIIVGYLTALVAKPKEK